MTPEITQDVVISLYCLPPAHYPSGYSNLPSSPLTQFFTATFVAAAKISAGGQPLAHENIVACSWWYHTLAHSNKYYIYIYNITPK